jgi:transcription elongation factor GreA
MKRPVTPRGYRRMQDELKELKAQRPELAIAIEKAREHGDLKENADYDAAKNKSGMVEAKIRDLEGRLAESAVIDPLALKSINKVVFGLTVEIEDLANGERKSYSIYGTEESDLNKGWISYETPLAKALIGKEVNDVVTVRLPAGAREYEILDITIAYSEAD